MKKKNEIKQAKPDKVRAIVAIQLLSKQLDKIENIDDRLIAEGLLMEILKNI